MEPRSSFDPTSWAVWHPTKDHKHADHEPAPLRTTPIHVSEEAAVFEHEVLEATLRDTLFEMLDGANLAAPVLKAEETHIIVPDHDSSGLVLKEVIGPAGQTGATVAPRIGSDQLGLAQRNKHPVEVSAA